MNMKFSVVAPPQQPQFALLGDIYLCQAAWVLQYPEYAKQYAEISDKGGFVILDWQHVGTDAPAVGLTFDDLWQAIDLVGPCEVVIPDVLCHRDETVANAKTFLHTNFERLLDEGISTMFVPQGLEYREWQQCLDDITGDKFCSDVVGCIGIPKVLDSDPFTRTRAAGIVPRKYDVHLLGIWGGVNSIQRPDYDVRSIDTSLPVAAAQAGVFLGDQLDTKYQLRIGEDALMADEGLVLRNVEYLVTYLDVSNVW